MSSLRARLLIPSFTLVLASLVLLGLLAPTPIAAATVDTGYQTVQWVEVNDRGHIVFRLNEEVTVYYFCAPPRTSACQAILLTAISTAREVKVFYEGQGSTHAPDANESYEIKAVRIR